MVVATLRPSATDTDSDTDRADSDHDADGADAGSDTAGTGGIMDGANECGGSAADANEGATGVTMIGAGCAAVG